MPIYSVIHPTNANQSLSESQYDSVSQRKLSVTYAVIHSTNANQNFSESYSSSETPYSKASQASRSCAGASLRATMSMSSI